MNKTLLCCSYELQFVLLLLYFFPKAYISIADKGVIKGKKKAFLIWLTVTPPISAPV